MRSLFGASLLVSGVLGDVYMQNPRGSNNRLDEANRDRTNGNRLFDSQNNNRGGYNVGQIYYYERSIAMIDWTNQHSCGNPNNNCEMIIQYMCDDLIRDGTTTNTIPTDPNQCNNMDCDKDPEFGRQESLAWYQECINTERNKGLFIANQNLQNRNDARYTRQNPAGTRRGYECPEERDYYPYWRPTPWIDAAILTNQATRCEDYITMSQNVVSRWYCKVDPEWIKTKRAAGQTGFIPITQSACNSSTVNGEWTEAAPRNIAPPTCVDNYWSRDNHLGNVETGFPANLNWTVPEHIHERCVLRIRYNISTGEYDGFAAAESAQVGVDATSNANKANPNPDNDPAELDVWSKYGLTRSDSADSFDPSKNANQAQLTNSREYVFKNNPRVDIFGPELRVAILGEAAATDASKVIKLQLAIDTNQFGRTFQDRSHRFAIRDRPEALQDRTIHNVQVQGKRGNIVQTFPGTEYDFSPSRLEAQVGDYVHFQWTGSNTNPDNNAGQGRAGSDRHNVVLMRGANYDENQPAKVRGNLQTFGQFGNAYFHETSSLPFLGLNEEDRASLAVLNSVQFGGELSELDDAGTYFDLGPRMITQLGVFHYLCTRNNNFSNRSQKGKITVSETAMITQMMGWGGGWVGLQGASVTSDIGALTQLTSVTLSMIPQGSSDAQGATMESNGPYVVVRPLEFQSTKPLKLEVPYVENYLGSAVVYRSDSINGIWREMNAEYSTDGLATVQITRGGVYTVVDSYNWVAIIIVSLVVIGVFVVAGYVARKWWNQKRGDNGASHMPAIAPKVVPVGEDDYSFLNPTYGTTGKATEGPTVVSIAPATENQLPDGWSIAYKDGTPYYVNYLTGETRWEYPTD